MPKIILAALLLVAAVGQAPSRAATICRHQITDPTGDTNTSTTPPAGDDDTQRLDLVAADLATTGSTVTVALEVKSLAFEGTNLGQNQYWLRFRGAHATFTAAASVSATGVSATLYSDGASTSQGPAGLSLATGAGQGTATVDTAKHRVRMTFDRALVDARGGLGSTVDVQQASTWRGASAAGVFEISQVDVSASAGQSYRTNSASSCL